MTKMTSHRFNINGYHGNSITRRPFLYTHEGRGSRRDQGGWGKEGETIKTGKKVKKMGDLELGCSKGGEYEGKEEKNRNVKNEDERIECAVDFYGMWSTYGPLLDWPAMQVHWYLYWYTF